MNLTNDLIVDSYKILEKHFHNQFQATINEKEIKWYNVKYSHSIDVFNAMCELIENENKLKDFNDEDKIRLKIGAMLHDVGRFYQMKNGEIQKELNHGDMGKNILINSDNVDDEATLLFIKLHDGRFKIEDEPFYKSSNDERKNFLKLGLNATEDSDIVSNMKIMIKNNRFLTFKDIDYNIVISDEIIDAIVNKRHFNGKILIPSAYNDLFVKLALVRLLNFDYSKKICNKIGFIKFVLNHVDKFLENSINQNLATEVKINDLFKKLEIVKDVLKKDGFEI